LTSSVDLDGKEEEEEVDDALGEGCGMGVRIEGRVRVMRGSSL
jgi:hypothetical protein